MTHIEAELVAAIYVIYAHDCIHWLGPDDCAYTRSSSKTWKTHQHGARSFTLLNKTPVLADPLLLLPGFIRTTAVAMPATERNLNGVANRLNRHWVLEMQCRVQAMFLLLFLPLIVWMGRLALLWRPLSAVILLSHVLLMLTFFLVLRRNRIPKPLTVAGPLLLNPLGATRLLDVLSQSLFQSPRIDCKIKGRAAVKNGQ